MENLIKKKAKELGASLCGIAPVLRSGTIEASERRDAPARLPPEDQDIRAYQEWLKQKMHGSMGYMEKQQEVRRGITQWYPEAQSVVLCGFSYFSGKGVQEKINNKKENGKIARYALGRDYHKVLKKKLKQLLLEIKKEHPTAEGKIFLDTSPVLERRYARYAGIGWVGKNTMLISPKMGSFFFLGGLALNIPLIPDEPVPDHCGTCNRCITACPTEAFPKAHILDASRCIAYFTIEHPGSIPETFREKMGNWTFGCDICQEVCPWNRFSAQTQIPEFAPQFDREIPLQELARITEEEFQSKYKKTPMERAKRKGLLRNALLAMGNSGDPEFRSVLETYRNDPDPVIREQAEWSLKKIATESKGKPTAKEGKDIQFRDDLDQN
ncbi:MAG: tRNA epoxyqueuosine(34) reductase QueG [Elusimicrobia bacterium]|nr:tRNA epoxyqueuosine(34) reductase QueG [Elusimicrobiota bacterium]